VVLGDFNGTIDGRIGNATGDGDPSLRELRSALIGWAWDVPSLPGGEWGWTTEIDEAVIDFILLSPSLVGVPRIHVLESRVSDHRPVVVDVEYVE
jgi:endonuclease/exonuclease/phosphatase family metal-dependent hydrolase